MSYSNKDFQNLLQPPTVPQDDVSSDADGLTFSKLSAKQKLNAMKQEIQKDENVKRSKKGNAKKKKQIRQPQQEQSTPKYRDRAKERREAKEDMDMDEFILAQSTETGGGVFGNDSSSIDTVELLKKIDQSKYLLPGAIKPEQPAQYKIQSHPTENHSGLGFRVVRAIKKLRNSTTRATTEIFLPGRSSYVFNVANILGNDVPTTLLRSKAEVYVEQEDFFPPSNKVREIVTKVIHSIQESKKRKIQKPVVTEIDNEEMEESDDDIFPDAGDYCPIGGTTSPKHNTEPVNKNYFNSTKSTTEHSAQLPNEMLTEKQQTMLKQNATKNYNALEDEEMEIERKDENSYYEECYKNKSDVKYSKFAFTGEEQDSDDESAIVHSLDNGDDGDSSVNLPEKRTEFEPDEEDLPGPKRPKI